MLKLLHGQVPQPLQLPPLDIVQLGPDIVVNEVQLVGDRPVPDLLHVRVLQLLPEVGVGFQDLDHLLEVAIVLDAEVPLGCAVRGLGLLGHGVGLLGGPGTGQGEAQY